MPQLYTMNKCAVALRNGKLKRGGVRVYETILASTAMNLQ